MIHTTTLELTGNGELDGVAIVNKLDDAVVDLKIEDYTAYLAQVMLALRDRMSAVREEESTR